jgi:hypothetical protein
MPGKCHCHSDYHRLRLLTPPLLFALTGLWPLTPIDRGPQSFTGFTPRPGDRQPSAHPRRTSFHENTGHDCTQEQ